MFRRAKTSMVLFSLVYMLLGLVLAVWPSRSLRLLCVLVGAVILACGITLLVRYARDTINFFLRQFLLVGGILCCAVGGFLFLSPDLIIGAVPVVFGLFIIFDSLVRFGDVMQLRRTDTSIWGMLALVVLSCALGVVMVVNPFTTAEVMMTAIGAILMVEGVLNLCSALYTHVRVKAFLRAHPEVLDAASQAKAAVQEGKPAAVEVEFHEAADAETETAQKSGEEKAEK